MENCNRATSRKALTEGCPCRTNILFVPTLPKGMHPECFAANKDIQHNFKYKVRQPTPVDFLIGTFKPKV